MVYTSWQCMQPNAITGIAIRTTKAHTRSSTLEVNHDKALTRTWWCTMLNILHCIMSNTTATTPAWTNCLKFPELLASILHVGWSSCHSSSNASERWRITQNNWQMSYLWCFQHVNRVCCRHLTGIFATNSDTLKVRNQLGFAYSIRQICRTRRKSQSCSSQWMHTAICLLNADVTKPVQRLIKYTPHSKLETSPVNYRQTESSPWILLFQSIINLFIKSSVISARAVQTMTVWKINWSKSKVTIFS